MKMGTKILSADDARNLMKEATMACDINDIMSKISEQAKQGQSSLKLSFILPPEVKNQLLELGYKVSNKATNVDTIYWTI